MIDLHNLEVLSSRSYARKRIWV